LVYYTPADTRGAGFLETDHFGVRFPGRGSHFDLNSIPPRWLRDLVWDHLADLLGSPRCPRDGGCVDSLRRGAVELGAFLELDAPEGGHDPRLRDAEPMRRYVADQRRRERDRLPSLAVTRPDGSASTVTTTTRSIVFNAARKLLRTPSTPAPPTGSSCAASSSSPSPPPVLPPAEPHVAPSRTK
jgi:hypothetical protein